MMAARDFYYANSSRRIRARLLNDSDDWDLTGATVSLIFRDPAGAETEVEATIDTPATAGRITASLPVDFFDPSTDLGNWTVCFRVVIAADSVDARSGPFPVYVRRSP